MKTVRDQLMIKAEVFFFGRNACRRQEMILGNSRRTPCISTVCRYWEKFYRVAINEKLLREQASGHGMP
jgi:hypothetical protein